MTDEEARAFEPTLLGEGHLFGHHVEPDIAPRPEP
jgi:hypothetical protein